MLVYRDGARSAASASERDALLRLIQTIEAGTASYETRVEALLRAGELECALADLADPNAAALAAITDVLAAQLLGAVATMPRELTGKMSRLALPPQLTLKTPEGYAYYALPPEFYAALALGLPAREAPVLVLGIRSIGTSLGAIVVAALRSGRLRVERMSVRPAGHPFDRALSLSEPQRAQVLQLQAANADFVIVDEGPGLSGSSLLSVAQALESCGVPLAHIHLFCSHRPDPQRLVAPRAAERWVRYRCYAAGTFRPSAECRDLSGGAWREYLYDDERSWPACWRERERLKWLTPDGRWIEKFEGLPPYGTAAFARARALADEGYGPAATALAHGFVRYAYLAGRPARPADLSFARLSELARYLAFRSRAFPASDASAEPLTEMMRCNVAELCGIELSPSLSLEITQPVIADARMQPHEWRVNGSGKLYKTDGHTHGDDHLLPGPADSAWDVSGALIEWQMTPGQADQFMTMYDQLTGDSTGARLPAYLVAYCALRGAEMHYAALSSSGPEQARQRAAAAYYRTRLREILSELDAAQVPARPPP